MRSAWLLVVLAGCLEDPDTLCGDLECATGQVCTSSGCAAADAVVACAGMPDLVPCTCATVPSGVCVSGVCRGSTCGNGIVEPPEVCDDGNRMPGDGCSADCLSDETCGNGIVDSVTGEQCDDGNRRSSDGCSSRCALEQASWLEITPHAIDARAAMAMVYDSTRGRIVMFGGHSDAATLGDTWVRALEPGHAVEQWFLQTPITSPSARSYAAVAYDRARDRVVLFGGVANSGVLGDTWEWDGTNWALRTPATSPPARKYSAMTYDSVRHRTVLYGGHPADDTMLFGDTWEWDGTAWTQITPAASPPPLAAHVMAFDGSKIVIYGGETTGGVTPQQTWDYNGTTWTQRVAATTPSVDQLAGMTFDTARHRLVLFGGYAADDQTPNGDLWEWTGTNWSEAAPAQPGVTPAPRGLLGLAYDEMLGKTVLFGGNDTMSYGDTWEWNGTAWAMKPDPTVIAARVEPAISYDAADGSVLVFGGQGVGTTLGDTWRLDATGFSPLAPANPFAPRQEMAIANDVGRGRVVVFGGFDGSAVRGDTWAWDGMTWNALVPATSPPARRRAAMAYDAARGSLVLFGGFDGANTLADTWEWNGTTWLAATPAVAPPARENHAMAYDPVRQRVVLFGGDDAAGTLFGDTWEWDGTSWSSSTPPSGPSPRALHGMTYDPQRERVVIFGGSSLALFGDTWEWDGAAWTKIADLSVGSSRAGAGATYDPIAHRLVAFAGKDDAGAVLADVWALAWTSDDPLETCVSSTIDADGDGLAGCADPDCWARCTPECPPGAPCDPAAPHCGDGTCSAVEDTQLCPADCVP